MLSQKLRISYPIFLVIGGLLVSFIPGTPHISLNPDMVFTLFLPPLLYEAAWNTSWNDFWKSRRPVSLLAFGLVIFTSAIIAYATTWFIPGFTLALGFLLGGIVSPPDAVAATSVLKDLSIPKRAIAILEGESLINDASSLIVMRFAIAAIVSGQFVLHKAVGDFFLVSIMGIVIGLAVAHLFYLVFRFLPTTASIDTALSFMAPYLMYIVAEQFHFSGVLAVVSGGLFLSYRASDFFNFNSRMQGTAVWGTLVFLLNGLVFILIGLQLPLIVIALEGYSIKDAVIYGFIISAITIAVRLLWVFLLLICRVF